MTSGKQKTTKSILGNSETSCSICHNSRSTGQILMRITSIDSTPRVLSNCTIFIKIRPVLRELWSIEHEVSEFPKMELVVFCFPLVIFPNFLLFSLKLTWLVRYGSLKLVTHRIDFQNISLPFYTYFKLRYLANQMSSDECKTILSRNWKSQNFKKIKLFLPKNHLVVEISALGVNCFHLYPTSNTSMSLIRRLWIK